MPKQGPHHGAGALPNLIVIGAMKCGTTSLHRYLDLHPEVAMSTAKELSFFSRPERYDGLGVDWYKGFFDPTAAIRGESSPEYSHGPPAGVPARIRTLVPD